MLLQLSKMLRSMVSGVKVHNVLPKVAHTLLTLKHAVAAVQLLSYVLLFATPQTATCQASLSFTVSLSLLPPSLRPGSPVPHRLPRDRILLPTPRQLSAR